VAIVAGEGIGYQVWIESHWWIGFKVPKRGHVVNQIGVMTGNAAVIGVVMPPIDRHVMPAVTANGGAVFNHHAAI
jgi:hypothetical protein